MDEKLGGKKVSSVPLRGDEKVLAIRRRSRQNRSPIHSHMSPRPPAPTVDGTLRGLRVLYLILLLAMLLYVAVAEKTQHQLIAMNRTFLAGLSSVAAIMVGAALYLQVKVIRPALEALQAKPDDGSSLERWRNASFASYMLAEAIVLFGLCLRFLGGTRTVSFAFYGVGILLMLFLFPRRP
jgi:hypothetical protein